MHKVNTNKKGSRQIKGVCVHACGNVSIGMWGCVCVCSYAPQQAEDSYTYTDTDENLAIVLCWLVANHHYTHARERGVGRELSIFESQTAISPSNTITSKCSHKNSCSSSLQFALIWYTTGKICKYICNNVHTLQQKK